MPAPAKPAVPDGRADPAALRTKTVDCSFKFLDDEWAGGTFELYAAVYGNVDRQNEVIEPGAVVNLDEFVAEGVGLLNHDLMGQAVGYVVEASQDARGLRVKGRFHTTSFAQDVRRQVRERMDAGKAVPCSLGFKYVSVLPDVIDGRKIARIKALRAYEFSFVNLAANPLAGAIAVKGADAATLAHPQPDAATEADVSEATTPNPGEPSLIDRIKSMFGLKTKKGRALSRANQAAMKSFAGSMAKHAEGSGDLVKGLKAMTKAVEDHGAVSGAIAAEMHKYLDQFDPDRDEAEDDEDDAPADGTKSADSEVDRLAVLRLRAAARLRALPAVPPA